MKVKLPAKGKTINILDANATSGQRVLRRQGFLYEKEVASTILALCAQQDDDFVFYDIGANVGHFSFLVKSMFPSANIFAWEPTKEVHEWMVKIAKANKIGGTWINSAVSDKPGTVALYKSNISDSSNSINPSFRPKNKGSVTVQTISIDAFVGAGRKPFPHIIKIDAETAEYIILKGASGVIKKYQPYIIMEVLHKNPLLKEINSLLSSWGYLPYNIRKHMDEDPDKRITAQVDEEWLLSPHKLVNTDFFSLKESYTKDINKYCK